MLLVPERCEALLVLAAGEAVRSACLCGTICSRCTETTGVKSPCSGWTGLSRFSEASAWETPGAIWSRVYHRLCTAATNGVALIPTMVDRGSLLVEGRSALGRSNVVQAAMMTAAMDAVASAVLPALP